MTDFKFNIENWIYKNKPIKILVARNPKGQFKAKKTYNDVFVAENEIKPYIKPKPLKRNRIREEIWKSGKFFVLRDSKGKIINKRKKSGSNLNLNNINEIFKENKTFRKDTKMYKLKNMKEYSRVQDTSIKNHKNNKLLIKQPKNDAQYLVKGYYNKKLIIGRSQKIGEILTQNKQKAYANAWENFLAQLGEKIEGGNYDADEGLKLLKNVVNLQEGWVYYK